MGIMQMPRIFHVLFATSHDFIRRFHGRDGRFIGVAHASVEMVRAQKNQFKKGSNMPFTFLGEPRLIQTFEETDLGTPHPITLSLLHSRTSLFGFGLPVLRPRLDKPTVTEGST
jgi:hypothetical protein